MRLELTGDKSPVYAAAPDKSGLAGFIRCRRVARRFIFGGHGITEFDRQNSLGTRIQIIADKIGADANKLIHNLNVLKDTGYVESAPMGYKITLQGIDAVKKWRKRVELVTEFEQISEMSPQPRGRALQKLLAKVFEQYGWSQEEGVRTSHEEMDVIVHKEREYYLIECKWEKDHIEADVVRELFGKLNNREGVRGIIVSMSGFTSGAVKQAEEYANIRVILFFGPEDVRSLVYERSSFDTLLNSKYQKIITRKQVLFD